MRGFTSEASGQQHARRVLSQYLDDARRVTKARENGFGAQPVKDSVAEDDRKRPTHLPNGTELLSSRRISELVEPHLFYVVQVASEFQSREIPIEDLLAEGNIGLVEAAHRYNPEHEVKFLTYASWWIRKRILEYLSREGKSVRLTRYARERRRDMRSTIEELRTALGREPSLEEISAKTGLDMQTILRRTASNPKVLSLEHVVRPESGVTLGETLPDNAENSLEDIIQRNRMSGSVRREVARLPKRERTIIENRFGLDGSDAKTFEELGSILGLSRERTRQIEREALTRLRRRLTRTRSTTRLRHEQSPKPSG